MKEDKLGDLSMEFFVNALHLTNEDLSYRSTACSMAQIYHL